MRFTHPTTLQEISHFLSCEFIGQPEFSVLGISEIHTVEEGDIVFVDHPKYYDKALNSKASVVIIDQKVICPEGKGLIISPAPFDAFNKITKHFFPTSSPYNQERHDIHPGAEIYPNVYIGRNVRIGNRTRIYAGAVIMENSIIGDDVVIGPNSVIGFSAFYYKRKESGYDRMNTCGNVILEDRVEIGASCTIDAGVTSTTRIGYGTKIDNLVHIGHDVIVGKHCLFAAGVGIAGCTTIEDEVTLWGQVGCTSNVTVGKGAVVLAQSGIAKSLEGGKTYFGSPASEAKEKFREMASLRMLPDLIRKIK